MMKAAVILVALVAIVNADIYLHNPRYGGREGGRELAADRVVTGICRFSAGAPTIAWTKPGERETMQTGKWEFGLW